MQDDDWRRRAACRLDPLMMAEEHRILEAKQLCSVCPVLPECADWEATVPEFVPGVIAGQDEEERAATRKRCARCHKPMPAARKAGYCRPCKTAWTAEWRETRADYGSRQCPQCHEWFPVTHGNAKFCCDAHKTQFHRERARDMRRSRAVSSVGALV